jgi:hypothetical protein
MTELREWENALWREALEQVQASGYFDGDWAEVDAELERRGRLSENATEAEQ